MDDPIANWSKFSLPSIPAPAFTGDKGATAGGRASAGNTGQARADGSPKPALAGANGVAATPKGSERRVLFSDEVQAGAGAATPNLLAQVLASPGKAFGRIFGMGRAEPAKTDLTPEEAKSLADLTLRVYDETGLTLTGLATDFCVNYSALDAARLGFTVTVREDLCRGIDLTGTLAGARAALRDAGVTLT